MSENKQRKDTFFGGAAILAAGIIVVKVISAVYKMPLVNILGSSGYADFTAAFNIFNILLTVSTAGIPVAMSKMISEANASHRHKQTHKIFRVSLSSSAQWASSAPWSCSSAPTSSPAS